jgi:PPOX class probable F420-dependent enzyme
VHVIQVRSRRLGRVIDLESELGARAARHLREEIVVWMTTVSPSGAPVPRPVWFVWDGGETVVMYSQAGPRVRNLAENPRVTLNFRGDAEGGDIVVLSGRAEVGGSLPSADAHPEYLAKYREHIARLGMSPETFAATYTERVRIRLTRLRGH